MQHVQVRERSVGNTEKRDLIDMTICVQTIDGVILTKTSTSLK